MARRRRSPEDFLRRLRALDDMLAGEGFPRISPRWWQTIERFERDGRRRRVIRKGRRVGASTIVAPRLAVAEMLWGEHRHTPGAPPLVYAFLSVKRGEAANRLRGIRAVLDILGEPYAERGDSIELLNRPALFAVVTANFRTNVGETVAFAWCDEVARWVDAEKSANPAAEVVSALMPALATLPNAALWLVSSPLGKSDYHAKQFDRGDTDDQSVDFFTTWEANPTLTERETHALEPDETYWSREYAAIPSDPVTLNFFGDLALSLATEPEKPQGYLSGVSYYCALDPGWSDLFGVAVASTQDGDIDPVTGVRDHRVTRVHLAEGWRAERSDDPRMGIAAAVALRLRNEVCIPWRIDTVYSDQHEGTSFPEILDRVAGIRTIVIPWTGGSGEQSKLARFRAVKLAMLDGRLRIPNDPDLITEMRRFRLEITDSGTESIKIDRSKKYGHADRATALVLAASIALSKPADLAAGRETYWERQERLRSGESVGIMGGMMPGISFDDDDYGLGGDEQFLLEHPEVLAHQIQTLRQLIRAERDNPGDPIALLKAHLGITDDH